MTVKFTVKKPVPLARQQSAMIPLVEAPVKVEKISVFSGSKALSESTVHPMPCAELTNSTGMKLPAGSPIQKPIRSKMPRLGFGNSLSNIRFLQGGQLASPAKYDEKTDSSYRFSLVVPAGGEALFEVKEQSPAKESVVLSQQKIDAIVFYSSSREIPAKMKSALEKADRAKSAQAVFVAKKEEKISDENRIRMNLDPVGTDTQQGKDYLKKLTASDVEIDQLTAQIETARKTTLEAQNAYKTYLSTLTLD